MSICCPVTERQEAEKKWSAGIHIRILRQENVRRMWRRKTRCMCISFRMMRSRKSAGRSWKRQREKQKPKKRWNSKILKSRKKILQDMFPNFGLETRSAAEMNFEMRYLLHPVHFPYRKNQEDSKSPQWEKGTDLGWASGRQMNWRKTVKIIKRFWNSSLREQRSQTPKKFWKNQNKQQCFWQKYSQRWWIWITMKSLP